MARMCLCHTEEGFNSIQYQLLFKWRLFCDDPCGKDTGHSQSFLQVSIKDRLAILPLCTHTAPPFSFAAVASSNTAVEKKPAHRLPWCFLAPLLKKRPPFSFLYLVCDLLLYSSFSYWPGRKKGNTMKVNNGDKSTFFKLGDFAVRPHSRVSETWEGPIFSKHQEPWTKKLAHK